jgi:hypothetical protein
VHTAVSSSDESTNLKTVHVEEFWILVSHPGIGATEPGIGASLCWLCEGLFWPMFGVSVDILCRLLYYVIHVILDFDDSHSGLL